METIRRFPPVAGVGWVERSFGGQPDKQVFVNLAMAQRDPRAWGPEPDAFRLRPLEEYQKSVGWAEPAVAPGGGSPNSHVCPAKDLPGTHAQGRDLRGRAAAGDACLGG